MKESGFIKIGGKQRFFLVLAVLMGWYSFVQAHDIEVDGIYYNFNSDSSSVSVTYKGKQNNVYVIKVCEKVMKVRI